MPCGVLTLPPYRLKCHNKCTKEAPACRISFLPRESPPPPPRTSPLPPPGFRCIFVASVPANQFPFFQAVARLRRTESVPSDINNPVDRASEPHFGTLPKALTKKVSCQHPVACICPGEHCHPQPWIPFHKAPPHQPHWRRGTPRAIQGLWHRQGWGLPGILA